MIKQYIGSKLDRQLTLVVLLALGISFALYFAGAQILNDLCCEFYARNPDLVRIKAEQRLNALQEYVRDEGVASTERDKLSAWVSGHTLMVLQVHKGMRLVFDSTLQSSAAMHTHMAEHSPSTTQFMRVMDFADGSAQVSVAVFPEHALIERLNKVLLVFCAALFLIITLLCVRRKIKYLVQLEREVSSIAAGALSLPITRRGGDELLVLADCIDEMRDSLVQRIKQEEGRQREQHEWITFLSHDIRTPLTGLSGYLEVLQSAGLPEKETGYISKCLEKTEQLRHMTDMLFACFAPKASLSETAEGLSSQALLEDFLMDPVEGLGQAGFQVILPKDLPRISALTVHPAAIRRVFGNISANISRYADPAAPVEITFPQEDWEGLVLQIQSTTQQAVQMHGAGLGLLICKNLMQNMEGRFEIETTEDLFTYRLYFVQA